jgi:hypothetical protein
VTSSDFVRYYERDRMRKYNMGDHGRTRDERQKLTIENTAVAMYTVSFNIKNAVFSPQS